MDKNIFPPVKVTKEKTGYSVGVWNRTYKFDSSPLLYSMISAGEELLASPMRVVGTENGKEIVWRDFHNFSMDKNADDEAKLCQSMQGERFLLNTAVSVFEDGCMDWRLTIVPRGRSVNQVFGIEAEDKGDRILSKLWIEIPLKKNLARFYQVVPNGKIKLDGKKVEGALSQAGAIPEKRIDLPFKQQVFIGSCTNASYSDIAKAALVLRGRHVNEDVSCTCAISSKQIYTQLMRDGYIEMLLNAGVRMLELACGPCCAIGQSPATKGVAVRTTNRNFKGRAGNPTAEIYLVSPESAAASPGF